MLASIIALVQRFKRYKLKYVMLKGITLRAPLPSQALMLKFNQLLETLKNRKIHLDFENIPANGPTITIESTIKLITKELTTSKSELRNLWTAVSNSYGINEFGYCSNYVKIRNALESLTLLGSLVKRKIIITLFV